ncbi:MAG: MATE family efflux transporter [Peptoniphilaceae bacterium]|nr:MATE family efflux transporter [Peptoniphilaceae bacterium]
MKAKKKMDLTEGVIWKQILLFFLPIAAGTCIQQLYNAVDGIIVGKYVGTVALAAVGGSSSQIINFLIGFFVALTTGASVFIAQLHGAGRRDEVQAASGTALLLSMILGTLVGLVCIFFAMPMLEALDTPAETIQDAASYLKIYFIGMPFILILNMESNLLRAVGDSMSPFLDMLAGCITNIVLDFVFVVYFDWGVSGVAVATVIAQIVNMGLLTYHLLRSKDFDHLRPSRRRIRGNQVKSMMRIGVPFALQSSMYSASNIMIQVGINSLGTVVVASWAMSAKTDGVYWAVSNALGAAITTFIGQNIGAGRVDRVKKCFRQGMILSLSMTVVLSTAIMLIARPFVSILTSDAEVIETTYLILTYFVPYYFLWTFIEVLSAILRGVGDAVKPVIIIGLGICLFRVIWMLTVFATWHTLAALSLSYLASWLVTDIALIIYFKKGNWLLRAKNRIRRQEENSAEE